MTKCKVCGVNLSDDASPAYPLNFPKVVIMLLL